MVRDGRRQRDERRDHVDEAGRHGAEVHVPGGESARGGGSADDEAHDETEVTLLRDRRDDDYRLRVFPRSFDSSALMLANWGLMSSRGSRTSMTRTPLLPIALR